MFLDIEYPFYSGSRVYLGSSGIFCRCLGKPREARSSPFGHRENVKNST